MNDDSTFEETMVSRPTGRIARETGEFYFRIHILMIVGSVVVYLVAIGWMVWRLIEGGIYEFSVVPVVSCVLLAIMLVATRSTMIIACDGRPSAHKVEVFLAQSKRVSADEWLLHPSPPIGPLTGRKIGP